MGAPEVLAAPKAGAARLGAAALPKMVAVELPKAGAAALLKLTVAEVGA